MKFRAFRIDLTANNRRYRGECYKSDRSFTIHHRTEIHRFVRTRGDRTTIFRDRANRQNAGSDDCSSKYCLLRRRKSY